MKRRTVLAAGGAMALWPAEPETADVVIYGATPGGIGAAVAAARLGRTVVLCALEDHIGGIVSNGLTNADIGKRQAVGGLFYEFTQRVVRYYEAMDAGNPDKPNVKLCRDGYWYEANAAEKIFHQMIGEQGGRIRLLLGKELKKARVSGNTLTEITAGDAVLRGKVFVDATYEGDLAAMAGVPFRTGRESRSEYNEPHAGKIYMKFRGTELLPGSTGEADNATQGYCFRFHVTNDPKFRVPIAKPDGYRRADYEATLDDIRAGRATKFRDIIQVYAMPNGRFELNSDHVHPDTGVPSESLDLTEDIWDWPTATPKRRRELYNRVRAHNVGLIWLLQNDPEVPAALREDSRQWGWHREEWVNNQHIPRQVYVRQGRRILGEYVLTERDADIDPAMDRTRVQPESIAVIEWAFDPHAHHKFDPKHPGVREGYIFILHEPFQVPYGVLVPRKIDGLLVPVACSCSHVAYNALRMEPVFIALGEVCGIAAHVALQRGVTVRKAPVKEVQALLVERRGVITFDEAQPFADASFAAFQYLGARGLQKGYRCPRTAMVTRADGAERLGRILASEGGRFALPGGDGAAPLTGRELAAWLRGAGYAPPAGADAPLDLTAFAVAVYEAIRPATVPARG